MNLEDVSNAITFIRICLEKEQQSESLVKHDFEKLSLFRQYSEETQILSCDLLTLRWKKICMKTGKIIHKPEELSELWPRNQVIGSGYSSEKV